jgi:hypothetical protein
MSKCSYVCLLAVLVAVGVLPASAQAPAPAADPNTPPMILNIYRETIRIGKNAAHEANEQAWAGMLAKAQWPTGWLGTTAISGSNEAWYFTGYPSWEAFEKDTNAKEAAEALADTKKYSALDGELLTNTSQIIARYRPGMSYKANVNLGNMRYFSINTVRVKPGYEAAFAERWREIVAAHETAKVDEHWAVFSVSAGAPNGTFLFIYARKTLAELDAAGALHTADAYRDALGESGRAKNTELFRDAVEQDVSNHFVFSPKMSHVPKAWVDADPTFWTPAPPAPVAKKPGEKK